MIRDFGGFLTGLFFAAVGVAFVFEASGAWTFRLGELAVFGPLALIGAGVAVLVRSFTTLGSRPEG